MKEKWTRASWKTQNAAAVPAGQTDVLPPDAEGEGLSADDEQGENHAETLGRDRGDGRTGHVQAEDAAEHQIAEDVAHGGDGHEAHGQGSVAEAAEDAADDIISGDEEDAAGADADVEDRLVEGLRRRLHEAAEGHSQQLHGGGQYDGHQGEQGNGGADGLARVVGTALADALADQDRRAHGQAGEDAGDQHHDLAAGADGGDAGGVAEIADDDEVRRAVGGLQQQGRQGRAGKADQGGQDSALGEIFLCHGIAP